MSRTDVWSDEDKERIRKLWEGGWSGGRIGKELGVSRNVVIGLAHRNGWRKSGISERLPAYQFQKRQSKPTKEVIMQPVSEQPSAPALAPIIPDLAPMVVIPVSKRVTFAQLKDHHCRWPFGDGLEMRFCGGERLPGMNGSVRQAYCAEHHRIAYTKSGHSQSEEFKEKRRAYQIKRGYPELLKSAERGRLASAKKIKATS